MNESAAVNIRSLGLTEYSETFEEMKTFTKSRTPDTIDEIWVTEHQPVFTQGIAGKEEHILVPGEIPIVLSDRGGQVTYHGPGQVMAYLLFDLRRKKVLVRELVFKIEQAIICALRELAIDGERLAGAPGIYVDSKKIASLGLRVSRGCSYHGLSLNVDMDLEPFERINPCGLKNIGVTQVSDLVSSRVDQIEELLLKAIGDEFGFSSPDRLGSSRV
ncbi:MAG: octanoyltransferase [Gammaproteobacteria bacterium]|nr:octanoyltransferase [Gammaproteobacteria bacterium]